MSKDIDELDPTEQDELGDKILSLFENIMIDFLCYEDEDIGFGDIEKQLKSVS